MFIVVLLIARVSSEWVEISQTYHRQDPPRSKQTSGIEHTTNVNQWKRGSINKVSNIGNVRKVAYASVKIPSHKPNSDVKDPLIGSVVQNPFETNTVRHYFQNNKNKIDRISLLNYQNTSQIKSYNVSNFDSEFYVKDRSKLNFKSYELGINEHENFQSSIEKINGETSDIGGSPLYPAIKHNFNITKVLNDAEKKLKDQYKNDVVEDTDVSEENKMARVWEAVKLVADTISKRSRRGFTNKIRYLEDLKDTIIISIEGYIDRMWPDDGDITRFRRSAEARGHVEVPSSEGALMTISFLTFAVFLIKLVLQVIHGYKQKSMMVTPAVVAAVGRASKTITNGLH